MVNNFTFTLPKSGNTVTFKLLTHGDEKKIDAEIKGLKKINPNGSYLYTMIKHCNLCNTDKSINDFYKGLTYCKACHKKNREAYYIKNNGNK